jgi:phosphate starvation-inducible PhoH-like protein
VSEPGEEQDARMSVTTVDTGDEQVSRIVDFDDNTLLPALFGAGDRHLARIEQRLDVSIVPRGNRVAIAGSADAVMAAERALAELLTRVRRGVDLTMGEVDGAIRLVQAGRDAGEGEAGQPVAQERGLIRTQKRLIAPRSATQSDYVEALRHHELVVGLGPAGTGKTYLAVAVAVEALLSNRVDRIILTRPAVEAGERLGFLPGTMDEKVDPYMRPMYDALYDMMPAEKVVRRRDSGEIEVAPLAFMRGRTLANAFVILDEAQNATPMQMKMFLTRMGENSRMVVTGDPSQVDLPLGTKSGLVDAMGILEGVEAVKIVSFSHADVVRHPIVTRIVQGYERRDRDLLSRER